jgi:tryptophan 7-halogenase
MHGASRFSVLMNKQHAPIWMRDNNEINIISDGFGYHLDIQKLTHFLFRKNKEIGVEFHDLEVLEAKLNQLGNTAIIALMRYN